MKKLFSGIKWFEDTLTSAFLSIVVLITLANVVARYVNGMPAIPEKRGGVQA